MLGKLVESWTRKKTKKNKNTENKTKFQWRAAFYLPPVPEVYNVHVGLLDVPLQVLWALLLLHVHGEGQLIILQPGLRHRLRRERGMSPDTASAER